MLILLGQIPARIKMSRPDTVKKAMGGIRKKTTPKRSTSSEDGEVTKQSPDGSETFVLFYGNHSVFSNFLPSKFVLGGNTFSCTEQYFHYMKAVEFHDEETGKQILSTPSPRMHKQFGRQVMNYDEKKWAEVGPRAMKDGIRAKFEQNADLREHLLSTSGKTLVEASPRDRKWGIGLGVHNPNAADRRQWKGKNLLGQILMEVRDELMQFHDTDSNTSGASASASA